VIITFTVLGDPIPQGSMKALSNRNTGRTMLISDNPKLKAWRELVAIRAKCAMDRAPLFTGALKLSAEFRLRRSLSVKRSQVTVKPDIDKLARAVFDAMTGVVYVDDAQVIHLACVKIYSPQPGVTITIEEL